MTSSLTTPASYAFFFQVNWTSELGPMLPAATLWAGWRRGKFEVAEQRECIPFVPRFRTPAPSPANKGNADEARQRSWNREDGLKAVENFENNNRSIGLYVSLIVVWSWLPVGKHFLQKRMVHQPFSGRTLRLWFVVLFFLGCGFMTKTSHSNMPSWALSVQFPLGCFHCFHDISKSN